MENLAHLALNLSCSSVVVQAAVLDSQFIDLFSPFNDICVAPDVDTGEGYVVEAFAIAWSLVSIDFCLIFGSLTLYDQPQILP